MTLNEINTESKEGKLLIAALSILTVSDNLQIMGKEVNGRQLEPDVMLSKIEEVSDYMYKQKV